MRVHFYSTLGTHTRADRRAGCATELAGPARYSGVYFPWTTFTIQEALQGHSPGISGPAFGILCRCKIVLLSIRHHLPKVLHCPLYIQKPIKTLVSLIKPSYPGLYVLARAANNSRRILVYQWEYWFISGNTPVLIAVSGVGY